MFKLELIYKSTNGEYTEHESHHSSIDEAIDEANDVAFSTIGYNLESWQLIASFGEEGFLYYFYPFDGDTSTKYTIRIFRTV